jgi:hypothetical protein
MNVGGCCRLAAEGRIVLHFACHIHFPTRLLTNAPLQKTHREIIRGATHRFWVVKGVQRYGVQACQVLTSCSDETEKRKHGGATVSIGKSTEVGKVHPPLQPFSSNCHRHSDSSAALCSQNAKRTIPKNVLRCNRGMNIESSSGQNTGFESSQKVSPVCLSLSEEYQRSVLSPESRGRPLPWHTLHSHCGACASGSWTPGPSGR